MGRSGSGEDLDGTEVTERHKTSCFTNDSSTKLQETSSSDNQRSRYGNNDSIGGSGRQRQKHPKKRKDEEKEQRVCGCTSRYSRRRDFGRVGPLRDCEPLTPTVLVDDIRD